MTDKATIIKSLTDGVDQFNELINNLNEENFEANYNNKWSAGQDLVHLIKVLKIVNIGFTLPKPLLHLMYEDLIGSLRRHRRETKSPSLEQLKLMLQKSVADGQISPQERQLIADFMKEHKITREQFIALLKSSGWTEKEWTRGEQQQDDGSGKLKGVA